MAIPFVSAMDFTYGEVAEVVPGIRRIVARNPSPFTLHGTGTYIVGRGRVAVIDPGPALPAHIDAILRATAGETISHVLVTHCHRDHSPGCGLLAEHVDAETYAFGPHGGRDAALAATVEEGADWDFEPDIRVAHGEILTGEDWTIECVHTPGHTSNHMCYALRAASGDALFTGDHVMGWATSVISPPDGHMGSYMRSLELLLRRRDPVYWPTHGPAITDPERHVRAFIAHRLNREAQIRAQLRAGVTRIARMVPVMYADVSPALHGAAARSVLAAIIRMVEQGEVACAGPPALESEFRLGA